jgi:hypothetical protein
MLAGLCLGAFLLTWRIGGQHQAHVTAGVRLVSEMAVFPNCRFGVTAGNDVLDYDVASLNVGWYLNWSTWDSPPQPGGAEFMQMVRLEQVAWGYTVSPPTTTLLSLVDAHPSATWLIGNEPDGYQFADDTDSIDPTIYARAYHDLYELIKNRDPSAQIAIGPIIQPTPLRFEYLDTVWETYRQTYSETMPVDVWNVHSFILRETINPPVPEPCGSNTISVWGAFVPRGSSAQSGELYCIRDQDDLDIFWQRIRDFRQWMADRGERNKPLIITEYGVLFPEDYTDEDGVTFSADRVAMYMTGTFELLLNETDPFIGYPYDGNRLVQRWAWFSLSQDPYWWGGTLFDPATHQLRELGQQFQNYTTAISPTVDLLAAEAFTLPPVYWYADAPVTATLKAVVSNIGNISATVPVSVTFYDGPPGEAGTQMIGAPVVFSGRVGGCADFVTFETQWPGLPAGVHPFFVQVTGGGDEQNTNNVVEGKVLVASWRVFLPAAFKGQ